MSKLCINTRNIKRGDIFYYYDEGSEGSVQKGSRPVMVVQSNFLNERSPSVIVAPITTSIKKPSMRAHVVLGARFGLKAESMILLEQLRTVNAEDLFAYIGTIDDREVLNRVEAGLRDVLSLHLRKQIKGDVRCLCNDCMDKLKAKNLYFISRTDSFEKELYSCEYCGHYGRRYLVIRRQYEKAVNKDEKNKS